MASLRRAGKVGPVCRARSHGNPGEPFVSVHSAPDRHLRYPAQKDSCFGQIDSLFGSSNGRGNHSPRKTLPGVIEITAEELAKTCAELASNKKAEEIVGLVVREILFFTFFFMFCSATAEPQLKAIANEIQT